MFTGRWQIGRVSEVQLTVLKRYDIFIVARADCEACVIRSYRVLSYSFTFILDPCLALLHELTIKEHRIID